MENVLVPLSDLYITHAEYQGCFIKIWANFHSQKTSNIENSMQDYASYTKDVHKLDIYGNTLYVYIWKNGSNTGVYRCQVVYSDLIAKTHTILLIDYGRKMVVSFSDIREVSVTMNQSFLNSLSQMASIHTFFLSGYVAKPKLNNDLINILCNKYYKYRCDFEVGGVTFISIYGVDNNLVNKGVADTIDIATMSIIANNMASVIASNNTNNMIQNYPIPNKALLINSVLKPQCLDYATFINIAITHISIENNIVLLTVQTVNNETELLNDMLNAIDRQNLKLAPILEVYTSCLIVLFNKLVRAIILEVKINELYVDLVDFGRREFVPRAAVFEIPSNCKLIEMRSLNVILDQPNNVAIHKNVFDQNYYEMLPLKIDPNFGLYKVKLFKKRNQVLIDVFNTSVNDIDLNQSSITCQSPELISITEISEEVNNINSSEAINCTILSNISHDDKTKEENENKNVNSKEILNKVTPIMFLRREWLSNKENQEIIGSLIHYKSPYNFCIRKYHSNFAPFMDQIKSTLNTRIILTQNDLIKNMYVIYQNKLNFIYRAQVVDMDFESTKIKLQLADEGNEIVNENFNEIVLYNFIESDCQLQKQLVLECSLYDMWFPFLTADILLLLQPFFNTELLYKIKIIKTDESGVNFIQMFQKDNDIDISNNILESGIGQRLCAAMKTDENPYEENLLIGQSFLSYVYCYHFKMCIQPEPNTVNELEEEIEEFIKSNSNYEPNVNNLPNTYCLATLNNDQWYRAYIKIINEASVIVNMFDVGLLTDVGLNQIRPIPNNLMRKPQLCLDSVLENKDFNLKITEKTLYCVTVVSINTNGMLCITIKEHTTSPLSSPIVRGLEKISLVHVDGDLTYLQRSQDTLIVEKLAETLSKLNDSLESKLLIVPGDICTFKSHGKYYRCVVKSINSKMAVVHCIDFGFEKQVKKKELQYLGHSKIGLLPSLVITVKTFPMAFNMSKTTFLANMSIDDDGVLSASPNNTNSMWTHNLLKESLENGCLVKITSVYSNDDFWIVPDLFFDTLKSISKTLIKMQSKMIPTVTQVGSLCAALNSQTNLWHRAMILNENMETENMLSIDSGERFNALTTTKMVSEIQKIPNCAIHCKTVSNIDIKTLLNKCLKCKLISCSQSLLEVQLFTDDSNETVITSLKTFEEEWKVCIERFESFSEFYVIKINEKHEEPDGQKNCSKQPSVETLSNERNTKILTSQNNDKLHTNNMPNTKLHYRCCMEQEVEDINFMDPNNLPLISGVMIAYEWIVKMSNDKEPYKVTALTTNDGQNYIDIIYEMCFPNNYEVSINSKSPKKETESVMNMEYSDDNNINPVIEKPMSNISVKTSLELPTVETVTIKCVETFKHFYVKSNSLTTLFLQKINSDLDMCIIELPINDNLIGSIVVTSSQSVNGAWCRAKVEYIISDGISAYCYFLDLGIYEECNQFYKPTNFLCECPPLVRRCSLYTPMLGGKESEIWYSSINDVFKDILTIDRPNFEMTVKEDGDPCVVIMWLENAVVSDMLNPIFVQILHASSLTDFKITSISANQRAVTKLLESDNILKICVENPIVNNFYLADINSKLKRVKFETNGGIKYMVTDIDDTLDIISVPELYEVPESISHIPIFTMACSLIYNPKDEGIYSLSKFQKLAYSKVTFIMCMITESYGKAPNLVRLYLNNKDVLDLIKFE